MYERRFIKCIDDLIKKASKDETYEAIKVVKYAHNENLPECELKYDFHFESSSDKEKFIKSFNSMPIITDANVELIDCGGTVAVLFVSWESDAPDARMAFEEKFIGKYKEEYGYNPEGSREEDYSILSGDWCWGELNTLIL